MLRDYSRTIAGKEQLLIGAIAKALEIIPRQLCDNAGFDATNILNKLRQKHAQGRSTTFDCFCIENIRLSKVAKELNSRVLQHYGSRKLFLNFQFCKHVELSHRATDFVTCLGADEIRLYVKQFFAQ